MVLQDRMPSPVLEEVNNQLNNIFSPKKLVCICSYSDDEPIDDFLAAAELLNDENLCIYMTGDNDSNLSRVKIPKNVIFTGYLSDKNYWKLLQASDLIVDLTTRENCLLCGAYEAVSLGKPIILSNSVALRSYFHKGVVYTENSAENIAVSIKTALSSIDDLQAIVLELKDELIHDWEPKGELFINLCSRLSTLSKETSFETAAFKAY
jgi:glycosyltransferase involved in cell wall biosynthesis